MADGFDPADGIGHLLKEAFAGIGAEADFAGLPVVDKRAGEIAEFGGVEIGAEALLGGGHEGAVEGGADGEEDGFTGPGGFGQVSGALDGGGVSSDHDLIGGIEIGGADDFALGGFGKDCVELAIGQFEQGGHGADTGRNGLLHVLAAFADEADGVREAQTARGNERGVFAEAVAGDVIGGEAGFGEDGEGGNGDGEQRRLGIFSELELVFGACKAEAGEGETERIVRFFKDAPRGGVRIGKTLAHTHGLRALAREKECSFGFQSKL